MLPRKNALKHAQKQRNVRVLNTSDPVEEQIPAVLSQRVIAYSMMELISSTHHVMPTIIRCTSGNRVTKLTVLPTNQLKLLKWHQLKQIIETRTKSVMLMKKHKDVLWVITSRRSKTLPSRNVKQNAPRKANVLVLNSSDSVV